MSKQKEDESNDIEICKLKIQAVLREYNCEIQTDDYHHAWLYDNDTQETASI